MVVSILKLAFIYLFIILLPLNEIKRGYDNNKNYAKNRLFFYKFTYVFFKAVMIIPICRHIIYLFIILLPLNELKNGLEFIKKQLFYISFFIFFFKTQFKDGLEFFFFYPFPYITLLSI